MATAALPPDVERLVDQIRELPTPMREAIWLRIEETLPLELSAAEETEFQRRLTSVLDGTAVLLPWQETLQAIRQDLHETRPVAE